MKRALWLIDDQGKIWDLAHPTGLEASQIESIAVDLESLPPEHCPRRLGIFLSSTHCFWAGLPKKANEPYSSFDLEEALPLDAEDLHFVHQRDRFGQNAIVISTERLLPLLQRLEKRDVDIDFIAPWSIFQLDHILRAQLFKSGWFVITNEGRFDVFEIDNRQIKNWQVAWSVRDVESKLSESGGDASVCYVGDEAQAWSLDKITELPLDCSELIRIAATTTNPKIVGNLAYGKLESNQPKLAFERSIWNTGVAFLLLLITVSGIAYYQGERERTEAESIRSQQLSWLRKNYAGLPRRDELPWLEEEIVKSRRALTYIRDTVEKPCLLPVFGRALEAFEAQRENPQTIFRLSLDQQRLQIEAVFEKIGRLEQELIARSFFVSNEGIAAPGKRIVIAVADEFNEVSVKQVNQ